MARQQMKQVAQDRDWIRVRDGVTVKLTRGEFFSLGWFGATIHGCAIRQGSNGPFISWPSFRGSDGKYVKRAYVYAERGSEDEQILEQVVQCVLHERAAE